MSTSALSERVATALLPRNEHRPIKNSVLVEYLSHLLDRTRNTDVSCVCAVVAFFDEHHVALPAGRTADQVANQIMDRIFADTVYDSELAQAQRATRVVIAEAFPSGTALATGWIRGHQVVRRWERHTLTSELCPECEMNPECYSPGGGTHCLDTAGCGWSYCV